MPEWVRLLAEASRNLAKNRRRSSAVAISLACGVVALCLIGGYYQYTYWGLSQSLVRSQYGHLQIYQKGYLETRDIDPFAHPLADPDRLLALLREDAEIEVAAPRAMAFGTASNPDSGRSAVVELRGVDPELEARIFTFFTSKRGPTLRAGDDFGCQIAPSLAGSLGLALNDGLVVSAVREDEQHNALDLTLKTLIGSYTEEFDRLAVGMTKAGFAELTGFGGVQEIAVLFADDRGLERKAAGLARELAAAGFEVEIKLWYEQARYFRQVLAYFQGFYRLVLLLAAVLVFFVGATTISISLDERLREFGTRLSLGESRLRLIAGLALEAVLSGVIGLIIGAAVSLCLGAAINLSGGIPMPAAPGMTGALRVKILFSPQGAWLSLAIALCVPVAALAGPAAKIRKASVVRLLNRGRER
jgi:putative ABC transport system permease protein